MTERILIVDDEPGFRRGLSHALEREGYEVAAVADGKSGLAEIQRGGYDLVLLDIMLPGMDGLEVCRQVRRTSMVPIIMLTARGDDVDRIVGLELGADDYLPKPFNTRELIARMRAVLRRTRPQADDEEILRIGDLQIDPLTRTVSVAGEPVELTAREFDLLLLLAGHPGRVFSREAILDAVWGASYYDTRTVDVCVGRIRRKLESDPAAPRYLVTRWGVGYCLSPEG